MPIDELKHFVATLLQDGTGASIEALRAVAQHSPAKTSATISAIGARLVEGGIPESEVKLILAKLRDATGLRIHETSNSKWTLP